MKNLKAVDPEMFEIIGRELNRQRQGIELIPSENFVSEAVLEAAGSVLTNKYSEGYPKKRYYGGNEHIDESESLAIERAKQLFGCEHANVQPHSGSSANMEAYFALMELGETFMGLNLTAGGHMTHGLPVNFSAKFYNAQSYNVDPKTHLIDMDQVRKDALTIKPKVIVSGFTAYPRKIDFKAFQEISEEVGAYHMADISHISGLCATGVHESPVPFADVVTTTTHKTLRGPRAGMIMCKESHATKIDRAVLPGMQGGPLNHIIAAKAVAFAEALQPEFKTYQENILKNAKALAQTLTEEGIDLVTGGTDNHLMIIDMRKLGVAGVPGEKALDAARLYTNKNTVPYDERKPFNPSGIRLGTPAITTRGMGVSEMKLIGQSIAKVLKNHENASIIEQVNTQMKELAEEFPIYKE